MVESCCTVDVRHLLPAVTTPTLVVRRVDETWLSVEHGQYLAAHIPDARYATFIDDCRAARAGAEPRRAIKEVLRRAMSQPEEIAAALPPTRAEIARLHVSPELTILKVVWAPGMHSGPHDHRMWACIGIYTGGEDNSLFRRADRSLVSSGGRSLRPRDVLLLGDDAIHAVTNPTVDFAGAIHVYGGDFFAAQRSEWTGPPYVEQPYDVDRVLAYFEAANRPN
jgi:predicted metal-dependent enzyme (double-stranded beta helix superfamily)